MNLSTGISNGSTQSGPHPARAVKIMVSDAQPEAGQCAALDGRDREREGVATIPTLGIQHRVLQCGRVHHTEAEWAEYLRRREQVAVLEAVLAAGESEREACRRSGLATSTWSELKKRRQAHQASGLAGDGWLVPQYSKSGRPSVAEECGLTPELRDLIQGIVLKVHSVELALALFADHAQCPDSLRRWIRASKRPAPSLLRALRVTGELKAMHRGPRSYQLDSYSMLRDGREEVSPGVFRMVEPGDWWEMDDMSLNHPFWFEVPPGDDAQSARHGVALGRQGLYCHDVASGKWLGYMLVGRPRDAYRAEDILRCIRLLMTAWGKPRRGLRLERGIWRSSRIKGVTLHDGEIPTDLLDNREREVVVAGLKDLGIEVRWCYSPNTKGGIEGGFRRLQDVMAMVEELNIGRFAGEFERAAKALVAVRSGASHPQERGFGHIDLIDTRVAAAMDWLNAHEKCGRIQHGIPEERWNLAMQMKPLARLSQSDLAVFMPERRVLQIRGGHVVPHVKEIGPIQFTHPELFARLGSGYRVLVSFDPSEPSLGAAIWNAIARSDSANCDGWRVGEFLGWAEHEPLAPQFSAPGCGGNELRKRFANYHRTKFRAMGAAGKAVMAEATARDGRGQLARVETLNGPLGVEGLRAVGREPREDGIASAITRGSGRGNGNDRSHGTHGTDRTGMGRGERSGFAPLDETALRRRSNRFEEEAAAIAAGTY